MIELSDKYFLQIEPDKNGPATELPIKDELSDKVRFIYEHTVMPSFGRRYKGMHGVKTNNGMDGFM